MFGHRNESHQSGCSRALRLYAVTIFYHKEILTDTGKAAIAIGRSEGITAQVALLHVSHSLQACTLFFLYAICNSIRKKIKN